MSADQDRELDRLIARRLYWQLPIIAMRARLAAERVAEDAKVDPDALRRPCTPFMR